MNTLNSITLSIFVGLSTLMHTGCDYKRKITAESIHLSPLYSSGMVLQTGKETRFNGYTEANATLAVRIDDYVELATANDSGYWEVVFPEVKTDKPISVSFEGKKNSIILEDVLAGKVFVIAGNAGLSSDFAENENSCDEFIRNHKLKIRIYKPALDGKTTPQKEITESKWLEVGPNFRSQIFCRLRNQIQTIDTNSNATIGIIDLSWPGSNISNWLPSSAVEALPESKSFQELQQINDSVQAITHNLQNESKNGIKAGVLKNYFYDENWPSTNFPIVFTDTMVQKNQRIVWMRKKINIPAPISAKGITCILGKFQGEATFYFNERQINVKETSEGKIVLNIPDSAVKQGLNLLAIRFYRTHEKSGIYGSHFAISNADSSFSEGLVSNWKYNSTLEPTFPESVAEESLKGYAWNAYLAPLQHFDIERFIWYDVKGLGINAKSYSEGLCQLASTFFPANRKTTYKLIFIEAISEQLGIESETVALQKDLQDCNVELLQK